MKISIITATFNSGATIRDTLDSVLKQKYTNYELIIKDGGSKDDTLEICAEYQSAFGDRLKIISCLDKCLYDGMNQGIKAAIGDVVGILNSDDFYASDDILSTIAEQFRRTPEIDAVYADVCYVKWDDITKRTRYYSSGLFKPIWMRLGFMPAHPSFYCRRQVYECHTLDASRIEGWRGDKLCTYFNTTYKIAADFEFLLRALYHSKIKTRYIPKVFVKMRHGGVSSSGVEAHKQINREHLRALRENGIYSNIFLLGIRYVYKIGEIMWSKIKFST